MRKITLKTIICILLIVFFGTFIVLAKGPIKRNVLEGLAQNVPIASVNGGNSAIDDSYKSLMDSSRGFNSIPGDNVPSQPSKSQNEIEADAKVAYQQKQQQEQAIADEQRKKQRDQYLPPPPPTVQSQVQAPSQVPSPAQVQAPSRVSLIPQSSQSMPMISLTPQQQVSTTPTTSSTQVEIYNRF